MFIWTTPMVCRGLVLFCTLGLLFWVYFHTSALYPLWRMHHFTIHYICCKIRLKNNRHCLLYECNGFFLHSSMNYS
uniref:Putative secreted protein n=1 Tax=Anopheles aquasalis TaxID=42839 RepID=T1DP85_ANOAQ